jgi:hypothetical protein
MAAKLNKCSESGGFGDPPLLPSRGLLHGRQPCKLGVIIITPLRPNVNICCATFKGLEKKKSAAAQRTTVLFFVKSFRCF